MYCIFAKESIAKMNGNRGKLVAQSGHAFLHAYWDAMGLQSPEQIRYKTNLDKYEQAKFYRESDHAYKICLVVDTVEELKTLYESYKAKCGTSLVTDAGFTVFNEPVTTCLGIGPIRESYIGDDLKALKVLI